MTVEPHTVRVIYFAILREEAGLTEETVRTFARTAEALYTELRDRHGFGLPARRMKLVVNDEFVEWSHRIKAGDSVAFIPPVAGGC